MTIKKNDGLPSRTFSSSFPLIMMGMINDDVTMVILWSYSLLSLRSWQLSYLLRERGMCVTDAWKTAAYKTGPEEDRFMKEDSFPGGYRTLSIIFQTTSTLFTRITDPSRLERTFFFSLTPRGVGVAIFFCSLDYCPVSLGSQPKPLSFGSNIQAKGSVALKLYRVWKSQLAKMNGKILFQFLWYFPPGWGFGLGRGSLGQKLVAHIAKKIGVFAKLL